MRHFPVDSRSRPIRGWMAGSFVCNIFVNTWSAHLLLSAILWFTIYVITFSFLHINTVCMRARQVGSIITRVTLLFVRSWTSFHAPTETNYILIGDIQRRSWIHQKQQFVEGRWGSIFKPGLPCTLLFYQDNYAVIGFAAFWRSRRANGHWPAVSNILVYQIRCGCLPSEQLLCR